MERSVADVRSFRVGHSRVAVALLAGLAVATAGACTGRSKTATRSLSAATSAVDSQTTTTSIPFPSEITATLTPPDLFLGDGSGRIGEPPGIAVAASQIVAHSQSVGQVVYGLTFGTTYPAISHDGGRSWAIDGPIFDVPGAGGPDEAEAIEAISRTTAFAWGLGSIIRSTTDSGQHWWTTQIGAIARVAYSNGAICAGLSTNGKTTSASYLSQNDGRTWVLQPSNAECNA